MMKRCREVERVRGHGGQSRRASGSASSMKENYEALFIVYACA